MALCEKTRHRVGSVRFVGRRRGGGHPAFDASQQRENVAHAGTSPAEGHQEHPLSIYLTVWILLFVLSTFSYLVDYMQLQGALRWGLILLFMFLKAGFIIAIFMHIAWERLVLIFAILIPPLCLIVFIALMAIEADYTFLTRLDVFGQAPQALLAAFGGQKLTSQLQTVGHQLVLAFDRIERPHRIIGSGERPYRVAIELNHALLDSCDTLYGHLALLPHDVFQAVIQNIVLSDSEHLVQTYALWIWIHCLRQNDLIPGSIASAAGQSVSLRGLLSWHDALP